MNNSAEPQTETPTAAEALGPRKVVLALLDQVLDRKQPLDAVLEHEASYTGLAARDKAFVRMVTATTLRRLGQIDDMICQASDRRELPKPYALHNLLRMAVAQIAFMAVPDYAVVDTAVRLADENGMSRQKGFVNAALRRVAENYRGWLLKQDEVRLNTPEWLMQLWIADYGLRTAAEIAQANLSEAPLDISVKDPSKLMHWAQTLEAAKLPTGTLRRTEGGAVQRLPGFDDGMWWVQDAAAALPARLFGNVEGRTVVDMCAAPGGKTAQLAAMGAHVIALDRSNSRLQRLHENMQRLRLDHMVTTEAADGAVWKPREAPEFILLDAPCTATGTIRRHPDVPRLKTPIDMERLLQVQARLLDNASAILADGGVLVYCTCSLQKDEGERQVEALMKRNRSMRRQPLSDSDVGGLKTLITEDGDVRILPFHMATHGGMDGFFIARLQKIPTISC